MSNPYNDPRLQSALGVRARFERIGDRVRGVVTMIDVFSSGNGNALLYKVAEVTMSQEGRQSRQDEIEIIAGSKNLLGQLMVKQPQVGDVLDLELIELRPSPMGNPLKVFKVEVTSPQGEAAMYQAAVTPPTTGEDDLFAS
jgi:hypothetical protein